MRSVVHRTSPGFKYIIRVRVTNPEGIYTHRHVQRWALLTYRHALDCLTSR